jgi:hypothetical protein
MKIKTFFSVMILLSLVLLVSASRAYASYGSTSDSGSSSTNTTGTPQCNADVPGTPVLYEPNHPLLPKATGAGEVRLNWLKAQKANKYTIGYGLSPRNYIYGAADISDADNYTVGHLNPGTRYYFAVKGVNVCMPGEWSREWSAVVGGGGGSSTLTYTVTGSTEGNVVLTVTPTPVLGGQGFGNVVPTVVVPTAEPQNLPPVVIPTPTPKIGFFQRILNFLLGR